MKKGFTLIEMITVVVVLGILTTLGVAGYQQVLDNARQKVCSTNLMALEAAVELYALEHDALPASLSQLTPEQVKKAYAQVIQKQDLSTKLSYALVKMHSGKEAQAEDFLSYDFLSKYGAAADVFRCPADIQGGVSYGINANLAGAVMQDVREDAAIVGDCDNLVFSSTGELDARHIRRLGTIKIALVVDKSMRVETAAQQTTGHGNWIPGWSWFANSSTSSDLPRISDPYRPHHHDSSGESQGTYSSEHSGTAQGTFGGSNGTTQDDWTPGTGEDLTSN
jgi:prepilin-type N-terminal cleavage/methylation domain-containing protein